MRELKFRAWDKPSKQMITTLVMNTYPLCGSDLALLDENLIVMQYTGVKDKNGKEIYEGDIVNCRVEVNEGAWEPRFSMVVEWDDTVTGFYLNNGYMHVSDEYEVIGNIYENPNLLTKKSPL